MNKEIQFVKMPYSDAMGAYMEKKLQRLYERYGWITKAEAFFKLENDSRGKGKICELELYVPGPTIFAASEAESFEGAAASTLREVERMLERRKAQFTAHV